MTGSTVAGAQTTERLLLILDAIPAAITYIGPGRRVLFVNQRLATAVDRPKGTLQGLHLSEVLPMSVYQGIQAELVKAEAGREVAFEYVIEPGKASRKAEPAITKNTLIPDFNADGSVFGVCLISREVTEEKRAAERIQEAQRMEAVGQLSGGLAHDFNNLLTVILGNLSAAGERFSQVEGLADYLDPAIRASRRGADITSRLLAFSRRHPMEPKTVDAEALVADTVVLLGRSLPGHVIIKLDTPDRACPVNVDPGQMENALVNLGINARDAMPGGGRIHLTLERRALDQCDEQFDECPAPGEYVRITVSDEGEGFGPEALTRAFEPFFTTKTGGRGSGLGLSMVFGFVKQSGGYIGIANRESGGARIRILLPLAEPGATDGRIEGDATPAGETWSGRLALLVEDDADVRQVLRNDLVNLGFAVLEAPTADDAAPLLDQIGELFVVVSDVIMPGELNGIDLARRAAAMEAGPPVVLITGFADNAELRQTESDGVPFRLLNKPFGKAELARAVSDAVARSGTGGATT